MNPKNTDYYLDLIDQFLNGNITAAQSEELQNAAANDPSIQSALSAQIEARANIRLAGEKAMKENLAKAYDQENIAKAPVEKTLLRRLWIPVAVAASIALLLGVYFLMPSPNSEFQLAQYLETPTTIAIRGETTNAFSEAWLKGESAYKEKNYEEAVSIFSTLQNDFTEAINHNGKRLIYLGISHLQLGQYDLAIDAFRQISTDSPLQDERDWYLALSYLAKADKENARTVLEKISTDASHFKNQQAIELLENLD